MDSPNYRPAKWTDSQDEERHHSSPPRRPARSEAYDYAPGRPEQGPGNRFDSEEEEAEDIVNPLEDLSPEFDPQED